MEKIRCDIIKDLIPSYVDGICSDATKECVEVHVRECNQCRDQVQIYRDTEISDRSIEQKQIDGLKKFHSRMKLMNLYSRVLVLLLVGLGIYTFYTNYIIQSKIIYFVLFPICMIGLYLLTGEMGNRKRAEKKDYIVAVLSMIDIVCAIVFILYAFNSIKNGMDVFFVETSQLGPFILKVWSIHFFLLVIGFVYLMIRMLRDNINNQWIMCLQMMGMFLLLAYVTMLRVLTSFWDFYGLLTQITLVIGTMGLIGMIVFAVIGQKGKKAIDQKTEKR